MVPPTEPSRFAAGELGKGGKKLEKIGAKFLSPNCFGVFFLKWTNAYLHFHDLGKFGNLEANLETFKTAPSEGIPAPGQSRIPSLSVFCSLRALTFGYVCTVHVRVDVGAGDVEIDIIYISFIMSLQYVGYLVPYKDKVQRQMDN